MRTVAVDRNQLPDNPELLRQMVVDLAAALDRQQQQLARTEHLLQQLLRARYGRKSEQLSADQLALFQAELAAQGVRLEDPPAEAGQDQRSDEEPPASGLSSGEGPGRGRKPLPPHLKRERIEYDLPEQDKHCADCQQTRRRMGEEVSERFEYVPASLTVIEEVRVKYACSCTVKTAAKPAQPLEKSTAGASLLAQVVVAKHADHLPLCRQQKIWARHGIALSRQTMCGWMQRCAQLLAPLYERLKRLALGSLVVQTDDTPVSVQDRTLPQTRTGRLWTYVGDAAHPAIVYDYTATRKGEGPDRFLGAYRGYLQADAYAGYDRLYAPAARGIIEVACWAHARRKFYEARDTAIAPMGAALAYIAQLYAIERDAKRRQWRGPERRLLREQGARPVLAELHAFLLRSRDAVLPKSPAGQAISYTLSNWTALCRYVEDGELEIDNNAAERSMRGIAVGRRNWLFFGSDGGGATAAVLRSFVATCERVRIDPWAWFNDVLRRIADYPITRLEELLPHRWAAARP